MIDRMPRRLPLLLGFAVVLAACQAPAAPSTAPAEPGTAALRLVTQCGLTSVEVDGYIWTFDVQAPDEAPTGFTRPFDDGTFTVIDAEHASYESSRGFEVSLTRGGTAPPDCL